MTKWHGGKGSAPRPVDKKKFDDNWDKIFGKKDVKDNIQENKRVDTIHKQQQNTFR